MSKRSRDSLTGGTGDVNPQFLSFVVAQTGVDTTTTVTTPLPIQRLPLSSSALSQVMEILKIFISIGTAVETDNNVQVFISTKSISGPAVYSDPSVFAGYLRLIGQTVSGELLVTEPVVWDLTDGAGHGLIIATDNIFTQVQSFGTGLANNVRIKILYRFKNISIQEYVGIVQGQQ